MRDRCKVETTNTAVSRDFAVTLGSGIEAKGFALSSLVLLYHLCNPSAVLRDLSALPLLIADITDVALVVHVGALAVAS